MTALAALNDDLERQDPQAMRRTLNSVAARLATAGDDETQNVRSKARDIRELLKLRGAARDLVAAAIEVECLALARLHQLGAKLPPSERSAAEWFASLTGNEIRRRIAESQSGTALGVHRHHLRQTRRVALRSAAEDRFYGQGQADYCETQPEDIAWHGTGLADLDDFLQSWISSFELYHEEGTGLSVADLADDTVKRLLPTANANDARRIAAREGVADAIRKILASRDTFPRRSTFPEVAAEELKLEGLLIREVNGLRLQPPRFVTAIDEDAGFVHIPWSTATVAHLRQMVAIRRRQAEEMAESHRRLAAVLEAVEQEANDPSDFAYHAWLKQPQPPPSDAIGDRF